MESLSAEIIGRIDSSLEKKGAKRSALLSGLGLPKNTIANWEANGTVPKTDVLLKIADWLSVDLLWLACGRMSDLTDDERLLVSNYRQLGKKGKSLAEKIMSDIIQGDIS